MISKRIIKRKSQDVLPGVGSRFGKFEHLLELRIYPTLGIRSSRKRGEKLKKRTGKFYSLITELCTEETFKLQNIP